MAIAASGEISLGTNTDATRSVACELGLSGTATICMNQTDVRTLAARTTANSAICFCNFYGKAAAPAGLGCVYGGGYYTGVTAGGYYLVLAPNASGCDVCQWKTSQSGSVSTCSLTEGWLNTRCGMVDGNHPGGNWAATRSINGFSDWYLPASEEVRTMYQTKGSMPAGQGYATGFPNSSYWTSTEHVGGQACCMYMDNGALLITYKVGSRRVRATRRVKY
jgi:hypothetical protein